MYRFRNESVDRLFQTMLNLETIEECYEYFADICTIKEVQDMAQRLDTAILLNEGHSYQKIIERVTSGFKAISLPLVSVNVITLSEIKKSLFTA